MQRLILASELVKIASDRPDVDAAIQFLNIELTKAQRAGKSRYLWKTDKEIPDPDNPGSTMPEPMNPLAVEMVVDKLRDHGYDVDVSDRGDRKHVTVIWDKLFYEKSRTVTRHDEATDDVIVPPPSKIDTDRNTKETVPLTWIEKWRANRTAESDAATAEARKEHEI